jgi:hypothetical protein
MVDLVLMFYKGFFLDAAFAYSPLLISIDLIFDYQGLVILEMQIFM